MNENSPLPQSGGVTCPNCGAARSASVAFCANCGAALPPVKRKNPLALIGKLIVVFVLFTGAIGLGALGACFMLVGDMGGGGANNTNSGALTMLGFAALLAILGVSWIVFWARREK